LFRQNGKPTIKETRPGRVQGRVSGRNGDLKNRASGKERSGETMCEKTAEPSIVVGSQNGAGNGAIAAAAGLKGRKHRG